MNNDPFKVIDYGTNCMPVWFYRVPF